MSGLDSTMPATALRLVNKFGTSCTITRQVNAGHDPNTGNATVNTTLMTTKGVVDEYADSIRFLGDKTVADESILEGDKKVTIAASGLTFVPEAGDKLAVYGTTYQIINRAGAYSGDLAAIYVLHCRKS